jgi:RNA polymerase sigma factor (sigma-70 family)
LLDGALGGVTFAAPPATSKQVHRTETDGELVTAVLAGDRRAFGALVDRHVGRVTALAQRLLGSGAEAEDIVQEATLQAYLGLGELRDPERFGSWFSAIAANLAKMRLRETRGRLLPLDGLDGSLASNDPLEARERLNAIHDALAGLSASEREAVLLHYVGGLTTPEIALRADEHVGTVRVRLHRARRRLQRSLAALAPRTREERPMVEVKVRDVVVRVASDGQEPEPRLAMPNRILLLAEREGRRVLPIWIGAPEGDALALHLVRARPAPGSPAPRPMTFDLVARLLEATGTRVERVVVSSLRENVFYAALHVTGVDGAVQEIDARPSDAINLAVRVGAPVFVDEKVLETAAFAAADESALDRELNERCAQHGDEPPPGEWRSLTPDLMPGSRPPAGR